MRALVAAVALAATFTGAAHAAPFRDLGPGAYVESDGERYAAIGGPAGVRVFDEATGRRHDLTPPANCYFGAVAAGHVLWRCSEGEVPRPVLARVEDGSTRPVPGWDDFMLAWDPNRAFSTSGRYPAPHRMGARWIESWWACYHCGPELQYVDWHTGARVTTLKESRTRAIDLDDPDLEVPLCAPLRRRVDPDTSGDVTYVSPSLLGYEMRSPWGLPDLRRSLQGKRIELDRCGRRRPILLTRCRWGPCSKPQLGAGFVTWAEGERVYAYELRRRKRRLVGTLPGRPHLEGRAPVQHTRRAVYVSLRGRVLAARIR